MICDNEVLIKFFFVVGKSTAFFVACSRRHHSIDSKLAFLAFSQDGIFKILMSSVHNNRVCYLIENKDTKDELKLKFLGFQMNSN